MRKRTCYQKPTLLAFLAKSIDNWGIKIITRDRNVPAFASTNTPVCCAVKPPFDFKRSPAPTKRTT